MNQTHYFHYVKGIKISKSAILTDGAYTTTICINPDDKSECVDIVFTSEAPLEVRREK